MKKLMVVFVAMIAFARTVAYLFPCQSKGEKQKEEELFEKVSNNQPAASTRGKVDINHANHEELLEVPGIGDDLAGKIIQYRDENGEFPNKNELKQISGIGERKFEQIRDYIDCSS